jgi:replication factor C subunit 1
LAVVHAKSHGIPPLWVDKYAPQTLDDFVGNASTVKKITDWLAKWKSNSPPSGGYKPSNFPGRGGNTDAKAVLISGSPGIGKSLLAKLACQSSGFQLIEYNASDYRSKASVDLIGSSLSHSSFTFSSTNASSGNDPMIHLGRQCLVMDEVDGMSAGDRGGNQALIKMIKDTSIPIICICNDRMNAKVRSLANYCYDLKMGRPTKPEVIKRAKQIISAEKANADVPDSVIDQIVDGADSDIRQVINQLEGDSFNWKSTVASFEKKDKSTTLTPFEA